MKVKLPSIHNHPAPTANAAQPRPQHLETTAPQLTPNPRYLCKITSTTPPAQTQLNPARNLKSRSTNLLHSIQSTHLHFYSIYKLQRLTLKPQIASCTLFLAHPTLLHPNHPYTHTPFNPTRNLKSRSTNLLQSIQSILQHFHSIYKLQRLTLKPQIASRTLFSRTLPYTLSTSKIT